MEESVRGFDLWFAGWSTGQAVTFSQAITEVAKREAVPQEAARQRAEQYHWREIEMLARGWETGEDWHIIDTCCLLLESGQVELRKATHSAAIGRRLLELSKER